jgi:hypothetical protein
MSRRRRKQADVEVGAHSLEDLCEIASRLTRMTNRSGGFVCDACGGSYPELAGFGFASPPQGELTYLVCQGCLAWGRSLDERERDRFAAAVWSRLRVRLARPVPVARPAAASGPAAAGAPAAPAATATTPTAPAHRVTARPVRTATPPAPADPAGPPSSSLVPA